MIQKIVKEAKRQGACPDLGIPKNWNEIVRSLFSPRGREYCIRYGFPSVKLWDEIKVNCPYPERLGLYINCGNIIIDGRKKVAIVGHTRATLLVDGMNCNMAVVILMHGGRVKIQARNYAVVRIERQSPDCEVLVDKDQTSVILW